MLAVAGRGVASPVLLGRFPLTGMVTYHRVPIRRRDPAKRTHKYIVPKMYLNNILIVLVMDPRFCLKASCLHVSIEVKDESQIANVYV